jgi:hypothetical protein
MATSAGDWRAQAACAGSDPTDFEAPNAVETPSQRYDRMQTALKQCYGCPVIDECRREGQRNHEHGIWGGVLLIAGTEDRRTGWHRQPTPRKLVPCGTNSAYIRHLRRKERPDVDCHRAHAAYVAASKARRTAETTPPAEPDDLERLLHQRYSQQAVPA